MQAWAILSNLIYIYMQAWVIQTIFLVYISRRGFRPFTFVTITFCVYVCDRQKVHLNDVYTKPVTGYSGLLIHSSLCVATGCILEWLKTLDR